MEQSLLARKWQDEYKNYADAGAKERKRLLRNYEFYDAIDDGQWVDKALVQKIRDEGKPAHTFNFLQNLIDTVHGHLKQEPFGIRLLPEGQGMDAKDVLQNLYDMDYARGKYQKQYDNMIKDALIFRGILQIYEDFSDDRFGNVGVRSLNPKHVLIDPYWNSDDIRDCRAIMVYSWMTAEQIKAVYDTKAVEVEEAIRQYEYDTMEHNETDADRSQPYYDESGGTFKVIEVYYNENRSVRKVIDVTTNADVEFDLEEYKEHSDETLEAIIQLQNPNWKLIKEKENVTKILTFAPAISQSLLLENADYSLQFGKLPFVFLHYKQNYEKRQGMVDKLIDPQVIYNKRQSMISHALGSSAGAGNWIVEKSVFGGDDDRRADFEDRISMNGQVIEVNDGGVSGDKMKEVNRTQLPLDILKSIDDQKNVLTELAMITPGMMGYAQQADESGALYRSKVRQAMISLEHFSELIKGALMDIGWFYVRSAKQVYSGPERRFVDRATNTEFFVNRVMIQNSQVVPLNYVSALPDYLVTLEEKRIGKSKREENVQMLISLLQYVKNPAMSAALEGMIAAQLELDPDRQKRLAVASETFEKAQLAQMEMQLQQTQQPQVQGNIAEPQQVMG